MLVAWNAFNKVACLISSYFYLYMASFLMQGPSKGDMFFMIDIVFESIFVVSMLLEFLTDYKEVGT
jgi:hypothetical protein